MERPKKKIAVLTASRAEYGLLYWLLQGIAESKKLDLLLLVSGSHLSEKHGNTWKQIEEDGLHISEKFHILSGKDNEEGVGSSAAEMLLQMSKYLFHHKPDALVLLGDRYEILAAAQAAVIQGVPVVHLHGGEISEGANDDLFRHATTKLSSLHFTSNKQHRNRVIQMGEIPARVKISGALGIENIRKLKLLTREEIESKYKITLGEKIFLVTFHPATFEKEKPADQFKELLLALKEYPNSSIFISKANADVGGAAINQIIDEFAAKNSNVVAAPSFGQINYLSIMKMASVVIGNSSSGIIEAPSMKTPTVNIGSRQKGRMCSRSVIHCGTRSKEIIKAIDKSLKLKNKELFKNPYDQRDASVKILKELERVDFTKLLPKKFHDLK